MEPSAQRTCALVAAVRARSTTVTVPHGASVRPAGARTRAGSLASRAQVSDTDPGADQVTPEDVVVRTPIPHRSSAPTTKALLASVGWTREIWGYGAGRSRQVRPPSDVTATAPPPVTQEPTVTRHATSASTAVTLVLNGTTADWTGMVDVSGVGEAGTGALVAATGGRDVGSVAGAPEASRLPGNRSTAPSRSTSTSRSNTRPTLASAVLRCHIVHSMTIVDPRRPDCAEYLPRPAAQRVESARTPFPPTATIRVRRARQAVGRPQRGVVRIGLNGKWMSQPMKPTPVSAAGALLGPLPTSVTIGPLVGCAELPSVRRSSASWSRSRVQRGDVEPIDGVCRGVAAVEGPRLEALVEVLPRLRVQGGPRVPSFEPCSYQSRESRSGASFAETGASLAETTA